MPGAGLTSGASAKALSDRPAFQPDWGKPAVRNDREDDGNIGIIRSPISAIVLPDHHSKPATRHCPTRPGKKKLFTKKGRAELESLALGSWASHRRQELLRCSTIWTNRCSDWMGAVQQQAEQNAEAVRLMTHPGVGPVTSLAFVLTIGPVGRFQRSKQVVSYLGLNPREHRRAGKQRLGSISKQGNPMMRSMLVEAGHTAARFDPALKRMYQRLKFRRGASVAKVAVARKLAVRMYWMLRSPADYAQLVRMQGSPWATLVGRTVHRWADWAPCLPEKVGEFEQRIMVGSK